MNDQERVTPIRLKGLDFLNIRQILPSPYFGKNENYQVAYMDDNGVVQLVQVECVVGEFNEGLTLSPYTPTVKLLDIYGAENMESPGQGLTSECQQELFVVGLRNPTNGKAPTIWLKHYKKGILEIDERELSEEEGEEDNTKLR